MAEPKTRKNRSSVKRFLESVANDRRRRDAFTLLELFEEVTGEKPAMWGDSIVGFGTYHYKYASGREGDWPVTGFSPRKASLSVYLTCGTPPDPNLLGKLGKHRMGAGCLYINKLEDVDLDILRELIAESNARAG